MNKKCRFALRYDIEESLAWRRLADQRGQPVSEAVRDCMARACEVLDAEGNSRHTGQNTNYYIIVDKMHRCENIVCKTRSSEDCVQPVCMQSDMRSELGKNIGEQPNNCRGIVEMSSRQEINAIGDALSSKNKNLFDKILSSNKDNIKTMVDEALIKSDMTRDICREAILSIGKIIAGYTIFSILILTILLIYGSVIVKYYSIQIDRKMYIVKSIQNQIAAEEKKLQLIRSQTMGVPTVETEEVCPEANLKQTGPSVVEGFQTDGSSVSPTDN